MEKLDGDFDTWFNNFAIKPEIRLSRQDLMRRLGSSELTISNIHYSSNFASWFRDRDPEGIAWQYTGKAYRTLDNA